MKLLPLRPRRSASPPPRSASPPQKICFAPVVPLRPRRNSALPPSFCLAPNGSTAHSRHENRLQNNNKGCAAKFKVAHAPANILDHLSAKWRCTNPSHSKVYPYLTAHDFRVDCELCRHWGLSRRTGAKQNCAGGVEERRGRSRFFAGAKQNGAGAKQNGGGEEEGVSWGTFDWSATEHMTSVHTAAEQSGAPAMSSPAAITKSRSFTSPNSVLLQARLRLGLRQNHGLQRASEKKLTELKQEVFVGLREQDTGALQVLEIGVGGGNNFRYYPPGTYVIAVDPNPHFDQYLKENSDKYPDVKFIVAGAEDMSAVAVGSVDAVVCTLVLCSVQDMDASIREKENIDFAVCADSRGQRSSQCYRTNNGRECVPFTGKPVLNFYHPTGLCVVCKVQNGDGASTSPFPFLARKMAVAIRGYPFHKLSAEKLAKLERSEVDTLALIDAQIVDVKNNTFSDFPRLRRLSLDSSRLTNVKRAWFTGLEPLLVLILSNNSIKQIEPGTFMDLTNLSLLDLDNNMLQVVDPAWLFGLEGTKICLTLRSNPINSISPGAFQHLQLTTLDLRDNDLSSLDKEVLWGQSSLSQLHVSSSRLSSVHGAMPHQIMWRLDRRVQERSSGLLWFTSEVEAAATVVVEVPKFHFCARDKAYSHELLFGWMFDPSRIEVGKNDMSARNIKPGISCGDLDSSLSTISIQSPSVVLASDGSRSLTDQLDTNAPEQCRQVWESKGGISVTLLENSIFRLISMATVENTGGVAMTFAQTPDASTSTNQEPGSSQKHTTNTNITHYNTKNITCILLTKGEYAKFFFTSVQSQTHTTETSSRIGTKLSSSLTHYSVTSERDENDVTTPSKPMDQSTPEVSTSPGPDPEVGRTPGYVLIPVVVSVVVVLVLSFLAVLMWKVCAARINTDDDRGSDNAHVWNIPGLLRSASRPERSGKVPSAVVVSCRSWPAVLHSSTPTYSEIPDDVSRAQRPLPALPDVYRKIQDDVISGIVRSASLPACTLRFTPDDAVSCRSLPAVLESIKHTYSQIPDHIAAAQRPLPALPRTSWEIQNHELQASAQRPLHVLTHHYSQIPDHIAAAQRPLPALPRTFWEIQNHELQASAQRPLHVLTHNYSEIPDDKDSGPMPLYLDVAEFSLHVVPSSRQNRRSGRSIVTYGSIGHTNAQQNILYRNASQVKSIMSRRRQLRSLVSQPTDQVAMTYVNVTDARLSRGQDDKRAHITYFSLPNIYWPWEIPGEGTRNTARRAPLPTVTLPNTYWPWEIPGEGTRNTPRRASLPTVTLPNTYRPWEIPGEGTRNTARRASLPTVTLPNIYWPWEIPGEGTRNTARRASLPTVTLPNIYWPWEIPGEGTRNTARRASLPAVTLPNIYWPWEIPGEGTRNTARRASLPTVTLPNTYWPWEIPGEGTRNTPRRASLPTVTLFDT
ncbi:hypothetical protein Bbelb_118030 [Branchiostoma belcheri]|nr:hypothetical protein Bbelb_118030 [Branchiostoma belcheri]